MRQRVKVATLFRHNGSSNMLLTITNTKPPATDLGYLLHKNPSRVQSFELSFGKAHVFYPEATENRCVAALLLDVDPVGLNTATGNLTTAGWDSGPNSALACGVAVSFEKIAAG